MKFSTILTMSLVTSTLLFGKATIIDQAKQSGLQAIPTTDSEISKVIDPNHILTKEKVELGKKLFFEPRLSKSGIISCNTCHNLGLGGVDGIPAAHGDKWTANPHHLNSPTVYNAVFYDAQFWDGRAHHLEDQAEGPMQATPEMASPKTLVEQRINSIPAYVQAFQEAYGKNVKINFKRITSTIGLFERTLITPSRYDDFLNGKKDAMTEEEKEGLKLFIDKGCASCHTGIALGGKMSPFQVVNKYKFESLGDFKGDKNGLVKTPTLRNITETAPYFHNGAVWSLADAVKMMGSIQLGITISKEDAKKIVTFFGALKGRKPNISYPQLPESTTTTAKPNLK